MIKTVSINFKEAMNVTKQISSFKLSLIMIMLLFSLSCQNKKPVDLLIINAKVYTVDAAFSGSEAFAVKNGKFEAVGTTASMLNQYCSENVVDMKGKPIYPGFIDAHCHFLGYAENLVERADLSNTQSFDEVIVRMRDFREKHPQNSWLQGRGWNNELWENQNILFLQQLDVAFPDIPIYLIRIDGHAALVNSAAIKKLQEKQNQSINLDFMVKNQGLIVDNAMEDFRQMLPVPSVGEMQKALQTAQNDCFQYGLTSIQDAGLDKAHILLIDSLQKAGVLKINIYAMLNPTEENLDYFVENGTMETEKLTVRCIKMYADGALGSRGALLIQPYSDTENHYGEQVTTSEQIKTMCQKAYQHHYQMAIHCIGDSANHLVLELFAEILPKYNDCRWRIEHAQIIEPKDLQRFHDYQIIPSVQPTHAISDMTWVEKRIGQERMENAYCYQSLLKTNGWMALGTDFPVEKIDPKMTFFTAVARKNENSLPETGFFPHQALSREEALKGITIWAAKAAFEEDKKGSIEPGKNADFVVFDKDLMVIPEDEILKAQLLETWIAGERVK